MINVPFFDLGRVVKSESKELHEALDNVINSGQFIGGDLVTNFEEKFARYTGSKYCVGVGNGLDAIRLILEALGIGSGDEVIVPAFTYYATWLAVIQTGAKLVPVDVSIDTANLNPRLIEAAITPQTKAVIAVHLFGQGADMLTINNIAKKYGIKVIEDAAQSHGAETTSGIVGSSGDASAFSFYPTKNLGALGDGGAVTTQDPGIANKIKSRRSYGQGSTKYEHVDTGWNSRLDPIQAEFLNVHMSKLDAWTSRRREIANSYGSSLGQEKCAAVIGFGSPRESVWHHFVIRAKFRDQLRAQLEADGIATDVHYPYSISDIVPLKGHFASNSAMPFDLPAANALAKEVVSLPIGPWLTNREVEQVCEALERLPIDLFSTSP